MSLLNDALRKKTKEKSPPARHALLTGKPQRRPARRIVPISILVVALAAAFAITQWLSRTSDAPVVAVRVQKPAPPAEAVDPVPPVAANDQAGAEATPRKGGTGRTAAAATETDPAPSPRPGLQHVATASEPVHRKETPPAKKSAATDSPVKQPPSPSTAPASPFFEKALSYHKQGDFAQAILMYSEAISKAPGHRDATFNLASLYIQTESFEEAYPLLRRLYEQRPDDPEVLINLAIVEIGQNHLTSALNTLREAERKGAPPYAVLFHRGVAQSRLGSLDEAIANYHRAEAFQPHDPALLFNLAVALDRQEQYQDALGYYRKLLAEQSEPSAQRKSVANRIGVLKSFLASQSR